MTDGQTLAAGRYVLGALLGRGGMAQVHRAQDERLDRAVAVKQLSAHLAADSTAQARFRREAQASASLNHPAIASVYDTGSEPDPVTGVEIPYLVMELVEGSTLRELVTASGTLPLGRALQVVGGVLDALEHSHAAGIIHRDIKPANVMITPSGAVKVMDFGIARAVDDTSLSLTQTATVIGTAHYLSPEQAAGQRVDRRSDLYSVGCLLFELVVGRPPFVGETSISIAYQHVREAPSAPSSLNPALSPAVDALVLHALAKDPGERYQSAAEMRADVDRVLAGQQPRAAAAPLTTTARVPATVLLADDPTETPATATASTPVTGETGPAPVAGAGRRGSSGRRAVLIALTVFLLLGLGAYGLTRLLGPGSTSASVTVPDVVGSTRAEAERRLRDADLVPRSTEVAGRAGRTVGTVVRQDPDSGEVPAGSVVELDVNVGPVEAGEDESSDEASAAKPTESEEPESEEPDDSGSDDDETATADPTESESESPEPTATAEPSESADSPEPSASGSTEPSGSAEASETPGDPEDN